MSDAVIQRAKEIWREHYNGDMRGWTETEPNFAIKQAREELAASDPIPGSGEGVSHPRRSGTPEPTQDNQEPGGGVNVTAVETKDGQDDAVAAAPSRTCAPAPPGASEAAETARFEDGANDAASRSDRQGFPPAAVLRGDEPAVRGREAVDDDGHGLRGVRPRRGVSPLAPSASSEDTASERERPVAHVERVAEAMVGWSLDNCSPDEAEHWRQNARDAIEVLAEAGFGDVTALRRRVQIEQEDGNQARARLSEARQEIERLRVHLCCNCNIGTGACENCAQEREAHRQTRERVERLCAHADAYVTELGGIADLHAAAWEVRRGLIALIKQIRAALNPDTGTQGGTDAT